MTSPPRVCSRRRLQGNDDGGSSICFRAWRLGPAVHIPKTNTVAGNGFGVLCQTLAAR